MQLHNDITNSNLTPSTPEIPTVSRRDLVAAVHVGITEYFCCPSVSGLLLSRGEVNCIVGGILLPLSGHQAKDVECIPDIASKC